MIKYINGKNHYYDKHGQEIHDGDTIRWANGKEQKVYATEEGNLGTDATNPAWIKMGRAVECEYGIYPFTDIETEEIEIVL